MCGKKLLIRQVVSVIICGVVFKTCFQFSPFCFSNNALYVGVSWKKDARKRLESLFAKESLGDCEICETICMVGSTAMAFSKEVAKIHVVSHQLVLQKFSQVQKVLWKHWSIKNNIFWWEGNFSLAFSMWPSVGLSFSSCSQKTAGRAGRSCSLSSCADRKQSCGALWMSCAWCIVDGKKFSCPEMLLWHWSCETPEFSGCSPVRSSASILLRQWKYCQSCAPVLWLCSSVRNDHSVLTGMSRSRELIPNLSQ